MTASFSGFESDLRISTRPAILTLIVSGVLIFIFSFYEREMARAAMGALFASAVVALAVFSWQLEAKRNVLARWITLSILIFEIACAALWFERPSILVLAFLPVGLAAALISLPASALTSIFQTALLLILNQARPGFSGEDLFYLLVSVWAAFGLMVVIYKPVYQVGRWSWEYYNSAHSLLEETRNRKAELEQAMHDLAEANRQLIRLNKLAQNLRLTADELRSAKEQFVANVSHELRTPINMIIGYTRMILEKPNLYGRKIPAGLMADLTVIERNADHLSSLINDILDLSQVEVGQVALTKEMVDFHEIVQFSVAAVQPLFQLKGLSLETEVPDTLQPVFCDPVRMREVFLNLLSNAGRFTDKGGVRIRVWEENQNLHVSVCDTGPGIANEDLDRLFVPFEQLDSGIRKQFGGTGLGLAISKRFIEMHNGKIWVESKIGEGTTFFFRIPIGSGKGAAASAARWLNRYSPYEQRHHIPNLPKLADRGSLVVVDQGRLFSRLLARYMNEVEIIPAADLAEANLKIKEGPTGALLLNSPAVRGALAGIEGLNDLETGTPLIAFSLPGLVEARSGWNVADVLVKPISRGQLLDALKGIGVLSGTILIADDDPDALQLFGRMLTSEEPPYRVRLARDGQQVLDLLQEIRPDAILLDLSMPNISGYQLLRERETHPELRDIPIIIISARDASGQPIVSDLFVVTQKEGFSVRQLLACIKVISQTLVPGALTDTPENE